MSRRREQVDLHGFHINRQHAGGLCRVHHKHQAVFVCKRCNFCNRQDHAADVGRVRTDDHFGVALDFAADIGDGARGIAWVEIEGVVGDAEALVQRIDGPDYGVVLQAGREDMPAVLHHAFDADVECMGAVLGEHDVFGAHIPEKAGDGFPAAEDGLRGGQRKGVPASAGIGRVFAEGFLYGASLQDFNRLVEPLLEAQAIAAACGAEFLRRFFKAGINVVCV